MSTEPSLHLPTQTAGEIGLAKRGKRASAAVTPGWRVDHRAGLSLENVPLAHLHVQWGYENLLKHDSRAVCRTLAAGLTVRRRRLCPTTTQEQLWPSG